MPTPTPQKTDDRERVLSTLEALVEKQALKRIVFSKPQEKDDVRAVLMPVILKGKLHFQLARRCCPPSASGTCLPRRGRGR